MKSGDQVLVLTSKGTQELRDHAFQLDVAARNILSLIDQGCKTAEAILQRSMFPHNTVVESLRRLLANKFVMIAEDDPEPPIAGAPHATRTARRRMRLNYGVSPEPARLALSKFCAEELGADGRYLIDAISLCNDIMSLQEVLNNLREDVEERFTARLPALRACVDAINDTSAATPGTASGTHSSGNDPMRLAAGISIIGARTTLAEFCRKQFGAQSREFLATIQQCRDVPSLQIVLNRARTEVLGRHRAALPSLIACARAINETASKSNK